MKTSKRKSKSIPHELFSKILKAVPILTVDGVIFAEGQVLLVKRSIKPYRGYWCLPGGRVEFGETVEEAVHREAKEETGLDVEIERMTGIYSDPKRDPRGHSISIAYLLKALGGELKRDEREASDVRFFSIPPKKMGFDHRKILMDAKRLKRGLKTR
jgi:8-oxo-dGTP diphosphatase